MSPPIQQWRQFWIFQADPKRYKEVLSELQVDHQIDWYISRFVDRYRDGDIVYLWIAGEQAGIYGWAEVQGEAFEDREGNKRLSAIYRGVLDNPLDKALLSNQPKIFDGLSILRNPTGTNFRVTVLEALELNQLIGQQTNSPPPDPDQMEDPNSSGEMYSKAVYVLDYRFDHDVKNIIASCLATSHNINQTFFPQLIIHIPLLYFAAQLQQKAPAEFAVALDRIFHLQKIDSPFRFSSQVIMESASNLSAEMASEVMVKRNVLKLLAEARRIAIKTTRKEQIAARHLIGAILQGVVEPVQKYVQEILLGNLSLLLTDVREQYIDIITKLWPEDKQEAWQALINEELLSNLSDEAFSPLLTVIDSDSADKATQDLLNVDDEAIAIAKILCARDASPPLAFGLFGEWGSGKTFFMRRIYHHVNSLTSKIKDSGPEKHQAYQSKVAQIWFNAWNYQDGSLWASLVNHVFVGLKQELKRLNKNTADEQFKQLMQRLDKDKVLEKRNTLLQQKSEIDDRINVLNSASKSIQKQAPDEIRRVQSALKLKDHAKDIETVFGIKGAEHTLTKAFDNAEQVVNIVDKLSKFSILNRLLQWFRFFTRNPQASLIFISSITLLTIISATFIKLDINWGSLAASITVILSFISTKFSKFGQFLKLVESIKKDVDTANEEGQKEIQQKLDQNAKELQKLMMQKLEIQVEIDNSQQEFDRLNASYGEASDETFASFIFDRAKSSDYKNQLGLLNTIRRDFSRLNELLFEQNDSSLPKIERIVLYIDDLDRCEPEVVVDVLQAIHLMLAFPLFMVVVGVDARWLGRSLKKRYSFLVHEKDDINNEKLEYHAASTHDYLEKIFQIPFWLKPLDGKRANNMISALLKRTAAKSKDGQVNSDQNKSSTNQDTEEESLNNPEQTTTSLFEETEDQHQDYVEQENSDELLINNLISTRALEMTKHELKFFQQLGPIVGRSPRAVKRFINLYRILKASHKKARATGFSDENGEFKVPVFLLAVICGSPKEAEHLFRIFNKQDDDINLQDTQIDAASFHELAGWNHLAKALDDSSEVIGTLKLKTIKEWIPHVTRFSYREWVELS